MDAKIKQKWVRALRSGKYQQGDVRLRRTAWDGSNSYCCLGVLAEIQGCDLDAMDDLSTDTLPQGYNQGLTKSQREDLAARNDGVGDYQSGSHSFADIAKHIQETL